MNKSVQIALSVIGLLLVGALLFYAGLAYAGSPRFSAWPGNMATGGMMGSSKDQSWDGYGMGMMGGGSGMMGAGAGYGMMGATSNQATDPLSLEAAEQAVLAYLADLDIEGLSLSEIMIFDNHAYAQIVESSTGIGAMEVLVDPVSLAVYPEHGPNMMWNLKYSAMGGMMDAGYGMMNGEYGNGMMGSAGGMMGNQYGPGMMGGFSEPFVYEAVSADLDISPDKAVELAGEYLAANLPGYEVDDEADVFYGYYTLHFLQDGKIAGMLSVNGFNGQIFLHHWHGAFIEANHN